MFIDESFVRAKGRNNPNTYQKESMVKQNVEYLDTGVFIIVSSNEEWCANMGYSLVDPSKRYAKWKQQVTKVHIWYDYICMEV